MRWMILGGGGCFGIHLARHLVDTGHSVCAVGRSPLPETPWLLGLGGEELWDYEACHIGRYPGHLFKLMEDIEPHVVVNFAALAYATSWENSAAYYDTNVKAVARITEWLTGKPWLHRFVQIGSSEVYGSTNYPADEASHYNCSSPYAVSKLAADLHVLTLSEMPGVVIRPSNCYAEAQLLYRLIPRAIWCARNGAKLPLQGNGRAKKTWMHAHDLARAIVTVVRLGQTHTIYNAGMGDPVSNAEIMEIIARACDTQVEKFCVTAPPRAGEDPQYRLSSTKLFALGWSPSIRLEDGIERVVAWMDEYADEIGEPQPFVLRP